MARVVPGSSAGVRCPGELDGPAVGGGGGSGGEVLDRRPHDLDAEGLEGDQRGGGSVGHIGDLEGDIVGCAADLVAAGLPGEGGRGGLVLDDVAVDEPGVSGLDEFGRWQGLAVGADVEDAPEAGDDDALSVGVGGRDGLVDEGAGLHAQVGNRLNEGSFVGAVDDDDLHVAGDLADEHAVAPLLNDEGKVELTHLTRGIPAEFAGDGVDREGGGAPPSSLARC